jgi:zinc transporter ZupT
METSLLIVIGAAFLNAVMTGAGALPFLFVKTLGARTVGWSNAAAAGLMLAASHSLIAEGVSLDVTLALVGVLAGLGAITAAKRLLAGQDGAEFADL